MSISFSPLNKSDRIESLDIMRGIVLFGILIMNINGMGLGDLAYSNPEVAGGATGLDLYTWITANMFFEGTMRALFSLLFGVGMFILLDRLEKKGAGIEAANIYFRRLMWLLLFGLIHAYILLWVGEILFSYSVMGMLVFSFRKLSPKALIITAFCLFVIGAALNYTDYLGEVKFQQEKTEADAALAKGDELTRDQQATLDKWEEREWEKSPEAIAEVNENMRKGYFGVLMYLAPISEHFHSYYVYRVDAWDILSMMLLGIALFKLNILFAGKPYKFYIMMVVVGYVIGLTANYFETKLLLDSHFSRLAMAKTNITYDLGRVPMAMGHIGMIMIFCKLPFLKWLKNGLSAVGKMALTNYVSHSIVALFVFTGAGLGLFGTFMRHELMYIVFGIWLFQLIASPIWLKYFQFGPLEWLWRYLTYQQKPPFRIPKSENS